MSQLILSEMDGDVAIVTLNRPERHNSLIPELVQELLETLEALRGQANLRALVLAANGRSFSTGGDVRAFYDHAAELKAYAERVVGLLNRAILDLIAFPTPVVAAVHGIVTGGSVGLVLACDIVLVAPETTFTPFYTTVGYSPDGGWTAMLPGVIGVKRAAEALLLDQPITAEQAVAWGMANRIVPAEAIRDQALSAARAIARQAPGSVVRTKHLLWGSRESLAASLDNELAQFVEHMTSAEAEQGMAKFLRITK
ncbi:MAG: enoyl-CoA hydratase/isomerase family protein [Chloroflexi bacterium]|nr:enoyl-CoA hydratase/isomerase family protein [Chloroflexota bacterium]